jgi:hypothetical protein
MMTPVLEDVERSVEEEQDLELVRQAMPGNLLLLRGLTRGASANRDLLLLASRACYGYAFAFLEDEEPERAARLYREGAEYAARAAHDVLQGHDPWQTGLPELEVLLVDASVGQVPALFWLGANWGGWVQAQAGKPRSLAQLPKVVAIMERVVALDERFFHGGAHVFFGVYHGARSPSLGGDVEAAARHLERAMEVSDGLFLLPLVYRARYVRVSQGDEDGFRSDLRRVLSYPVDQAPSVRFFNEVARKKARGLLGSASEFFESLDSGGLE